MSKTKVILYYDKGANSVYSKTDNYIGVITGDEEVEEYLEAELCTTKTQEDVVTTLVKLGVTVEEIIKLKQNDLI